MGLISGLIQFFSVLFGFFQRIKIDQPENHVVMITGCDSGFGLLSVHRLLKLKYYVVALCLSEKGVAEIEEYCKSNGLSSRCLVLRCDVTKDADIQAVYERVNDLLQKNSRLKLWAIVNNAGIAPTGYTDWLSMDAFRKTMDVNYFSIIAITKAFLSLLKRAKYSRIINICSMAGQIGFAHGAAYCGNCPSLSFHEEPPFLFLLPPCHLGSKHAVEGLTKCLRQELLLWNIFVTNINPAYMKYSRTPSHPLSLLTSLPGRTPILQTAEKLRLDEWNRAPKEITSQ